MRRRYDLSLTTQGPTYPPSEVMDEAGNFVVIGRINDDDGKGGTVGRWGAAIVSAASPLPRFGGQLPYRVLREFDPEHLGAAESSTVLHTLPLPLPCNNYPMLFAPEGRPDAHAVERPSFAFHETPIPDMQGIDGRRLSTPVTLGDWCCASGTLAVTVASSGSSAEFAFEFDGLIPESLYTVMSLRARDLDPLAPTRPAPLGVPNVFVTDRDGRARYRVDMQDPFPRADKPKGNRIVNVVVLWMSYQLSHGGAIGHFGLGGDIHAQLKMREASFLELETTR